MRSLLAGGALAATPALLEACGGGGGGSGSGQAEDQLVLLAPGGSYETALKKGLFPPFEKQKNATLTYSVGNSQQTLAKVLATKKKPQNDLVWASEATMMQGASGGAYLQLDMGKFSNAGQLYQKMIPKSHMGMPTDLSVVGIEYNTKVFQERGWQPPKSWYDLWDPKYAGHIVFENFPLAYATYFTAMMAHLEGGLSKAWPKIIKFLKDQKVTGVDQPAQMDQLFQQGAGWITVYADSRTYLLKDAGGPVDFVYPKEGVAGLLLYLMIMKNAPHPTLAHDFVNYAISKDAQEKLNNALVQGPVNTKAHLDPAVAKKAAYGQAAIDKVHFLDITEIIKNSDKYTNEWRAALSNS